MKLFYYIKNIVRNRLPDSYFEHYYKKLKNFEKQCNKEELGKRLNYYFKLSEAFPVPEKAEAVKDFKRTKGSGYYFDLKEFYHYFKPETQFAYHFGDETHINPYPTLFKARPIKGNNTGSVVFKLNKVRHFRWVKDKKPFGDKKNMLVWRGAAYRELRRNFIGQFWDKPFCNVGQTNSPKENVPWQKDFLPVKEQLDYKFILCLEGNDVATNLKWAMSSNSLCVSPKMNYETWFMEGTLKDGVHYIEVKDDFSDLEEKISYFSDKKNQQEAEQIIRNAHEHVNKFTNKLFEDLLCLKVLEKYTHLSGQTNALKF